MEWIEDVIGLDKQLSEVDESQSCTLTTRVSQLKLSVKHLKEITQMLQEEKAKCFSNYGEIELTSIQRSDKGEIISELILLLEQSISWLISQEEEISWCEKQMRLIRSCLKNNNGSESKLFINENNRDSHTKLRNKLSLLQNEEKKLRNLWQIISSLLKSTLEPKPFVDTDKLTQKVYNLKNDFYILEGKIVSHQQAYKEMIRIYENQEIMLEPSISVYGAVMATFVFVVAFVLLFIVLITLMMDDLLSNFVSVYHHQFAPS